MSRSSDTPSRRRRNEATYAGKQAARERNPQPPAHFDECQVRYFWRGVEIERQWLTQIGARGGWS